jgi:hypothetical protein
MKQLQSVLLAPKKLQLPFLKFQSGVNEDSSPSRMCLCVTRSVGPNNALIFTVNFFLDSFQPEDEGSTNLRIAGKYWHINAGSYPR